MAKSGAKWRHRRISAKINIAAAAFGWHWQKKIDNIKKKRQSALEKYRRASMFACSHYQLEAGQKTTSKEMAAENRPGIKAASAA